jgi:iron complex outermembrane receptor protein
VHAQSDETSKLERIQVTGSHIQRTDMEGPSPLTSLSAKDISDTGVTDLIGLFTKLPMAGQGTFSTRYGKSTSKSFDGKISGPMMNMPAGKLMLAVGAEYREETSSHNPDDQFLRGERDNTSIFAELAIPLTETLNTQVALRHEDYSDFGTTTDPKVAFIWTPIDELSIRGSYGTAFRAPSLSQIGVGVTDESPSLVDTVRFAALGNVDQACELFEYTAQLAGNPDLGPEESKSYNLGFIYEGMDNIDFSLDYYNYDIENVIGKDTQFVLTTQGANPAVVQRLNTGVARDPGQVEVILTVLRTYLTLKHLV